MNYRNCIIGLVAAFGISAYLTTPTPTPFDETMLNLRGVLETLEAGQGCVTLSGAVYNADLSTNIELEPPFVGLDPLVQSDEFPDFAGVSLFAQLGGVLENNPNQILPVWVSTSFAYIPDTYVGMPLTLSGTSFVDHNEPSASVHVHTFLPRPNRSIPFRVAFQFNTSGDVYLEAERRGDVIEYRTAFDFSAETLDGKRVRARGAMVALQDYESQTGITPTPDVEASQDETEALVASCAFD